MVTHFPRLPLALLSFGLSDRATTAAEGSAPLPPIRPVVIVAPPPDDPFELKLAELKRSQAYLRSLTTLDLIGETEADLQRRITIKSIAYDDRRWYSQGSFILQGGRIIERFHVLTVIDGKITRHEIIDRATGFACTFGRP